MENVADIREKIANSKKIVFLTGAGVSTESGIPDFRGNNGFWTNSEERERKMSQSYFNHRPKEFWAFYKQTFNTKIFSKAKPNRTHQFIANLEKEGKHITVVTQNIDGFHQKAGSTNVIEMHGSGYGAFCPKCKTVYDESYVRTRDIPRCERLNAKNKNCGFILKPNTVLFGDLVRGYKEAEKAIAEAELFVVMGTSLLVSPVNQFPAFASKKGKGTVLLNGEATPKDEFFDFCSYGKLGELVEEIEKE